MLAQNFKTSVDLGISEAQKDALIKTLALMETGKIQHIPEPKLKPAMREEVDYSGFFNMCFSYSVADCGTVACIRGTAEMISGVDFDVGDLTPGLDKLFYQWLPCGSDDPSVAQAAKALRSYLRTGQPRWHLARTSAVSSNHRGSD